MPLAIRGNDIWKFFGANRAKIELVQRKLTQKWTLFAKLTPVIWPFWSKKNRILDFFKVFLELFRKCSGIIFGFKRPTFGCILTLSHPLRYPYFLLSFGAPRSPKNVDKASPGLFIRLKI